MLLHQAVRQIRVFLSGDPSRRLPDEDSVVAAMRAVLAS
ncbi:shikimate dehydrogenase, partial [Bacillus toyonensis]